jgi:RNA polymerase sigma-70 factor, ECF subfamily
MRELRPRFRIPLEDFQARLVELARAAGHDSETARQDYIARLAVDDLYLAAACLAGEEEAWRELATHFDFMREFARRFVPAGMAREVADEVIADLWERGKLRQYGGRSTLRTWLATVVTHAALNSRAAIERLQPLDALKAEREESSTTDAASSESARLIVRLLGDALAALPADERLLLQLYYEQAMTLDELGVLLGASAPAISRRLKRTRESLRATLESAARRSVGETAGSLLAGVDFSSIEMDLDKLLGNPLSKQRKES